MQKIIFRTRKNSNKNSVKDTLKNKKKKNATEKEPDDQKIQDGVGKDGKGNAETCENNVENDTGGDNDETEMEMQKEQADQSDEKVEEVEAEVRREMDGKKSTNGKQEEADRDEIETLSDLKNGEKECEEMEKRGEEAYHLHNGLDEQEPSTNEAQDTNRTDVEDQDSTNQE